MTIPLTIFWVAVAATVLAAALPVTQERLTRFAAMSGFSPTVAEARRVIDHFTGLRRRRLAALALTVPVACLTGDPFYLVVGWCAASVLHGVRLSPRIRTDGVRLPPPEPRARGGARIHRDAWLLCLGGAVAASAHLLAGQGVTPARLAHAAVMAAAAAAVPLAARNLGAGPASGTPEDAARAEPAIRRWSARNLYLAGTAIVLSGALLTPGHAVQRELPEYSMPRSFPEHTAAFETVREYDEPTCPWFDQMDDPCRSWLVNGEPFPQAAPYVIGKGGAPRLAPSVLSPDEKAVVYLERHARRMVYQDSGGVHHLTGGLPDARVPAPVFAGQSRYVALVGEDTRVVDTRTWAAVPIHGARRVHDLNRSGIVATTASRVLVLDHRGRERLSLPLRTLRTDVPEDTYHLRPDGRRLVVVRGPESRLDTFDTWTGRRLSSVTPVFPGDDFLDAGLGWSERGSFLVRGAMSERVYDLDLTTGSLWRRGR
ncbi:hypothetical protein ACFOWE_22005 [Planomonospora corallina]|uniref:Uncharacterized protein n=1 Tax=Planomonospora corallina TaxID=1806052 RepID=A0ABV8ID57_9ACTN